MTFAAISVNKLISACFCLFNTFIILFRILVIHACFIIKSFLSDSFLFYLLYYSGVHGHFSGDLPWALCDEMVTEDMAKLVGELFAPNLREA